MSEEQAKVPVRLKLSEGAETRKKIVSRVGELLQSHADKFRVVYLETKGDRAALAVETILVYEDGDLTVRVRLDKEGDQTEQGLGVFDGSGPGREVIYRLDITRKMGMQDEILGKARAKAGGGGKWANFYQAILGNWEESGMGEAPSLLMDTFSETKVPAKAILGLLQVFDDIKLPDPPLGNPFAPTLQQLVEAVKKSGSGQRTDIHKLLEGS